MRQSAAPFSTIKLARQKLDQQIADHIQAMIVSGRLKTGDLFPPERELVQLFRVNRSTIREAIHILRERGLVHMKHGSGTRVIDMPTRVVEETIQRFFNSRNCAQKDLQQIRHVLEPLGAFLAAQNADAEDIACLKRQVEELEASRASDDLARYVAADVGFHITLAVASHNKLLAAMSRGLVGLMEKYISITHRSLGKGSGLATHREIYEAVAARDPLLAEGAMRRQMESVPTVEQEPRGSAEDKTFRKKLRKTAQAAA